MSLKDIWEDKVNGESEILAEDINAIAHSVIANEEGIANNKAAVEQESQTRKEGFDALSKQTEQNSKAIEEEARIRREGIEAASKEIENNKKDISQNKADIANSKNIFANALKGNLSGAIVRTDDVSPIEHDLDVKVTADELFVFADDFTAEQYDVTATAKDGKVILNSSENLSIGSVEIARLDLGAGTYIYNIRYSNGACVVFQETTMGQLITDKTLDLTEGTVTFTLDAPTIVAVSVDFNPERCQPFSNTMLDISLKRVVGGEKIYRYGKNLFKNDINAIKVITYNGTTTKAGYEIKLPVGSYTAHAKGDTSQGGYIYGSVVDETNTVVASGVHLLVGTDLRTAKFTINEGDTLLLYNGRSNTNIAEAQALFSRFNIQIEAGSKETAFEPYIESAEYAVNSDGTVDGVTSVSPYMTLGTDKGGLTIDCTYNRDINKAFEAITNAIISTGGNI